MGKRIGGELGRLLKEDGMTQKQVERACKIIEDGHVMKWGINFRNCNDYVVIAVGGVELYFEKGHYVFPHVREALISVGVPEGMTWLLTKSAMIARQRAIDAFYKRQ